MPPKQAAKRRSAKRATRTPRVKRSTGQSTLRKSITPGTIGIMLAGRFRGRRVVVLKQLPGNGPLVVTGPFKVNGVPLRRVNSRYIIATSTKVDASGVDTTKITPDVFKREKAERAPKGESHFMGDKKKKAAEKKATKSSSATTAKKVTKISDQRKALQKAVDDSLIAALKKDAVGKEKLGYLHSVFTLKPGDAPHAMKF